MGAGEVGAIGAGKVGAGETPWHSMGLGDLFLA